MLTIMEVVRRLILHRKVVMMTGVIVVEEGVPMVRITTLAIENAAFWS